MNNLLSFLLLLSTMLILVDAGADCLPYPKIPNADFDKDCDLVTITCKKGFVMHSVMQCIHGKWEYKRPMCKPEDIEECDFLKRNNTATFSSNLATSPPSRVQNPEECDEACNNSTQCTVSLFVDGCILYGAPIISGIQNIDLNQCISSCKQINECKFLSYVEDFACLIFNISLGSELGFTVQPRDGSTVVEKVCP